jgi:hypothetical protein
MASRFVHLARALCTRRTLVVNLTSRTYQPLLTRLGQNNCHNQQQSIFQWQARRISHDGGSSSSSTTKRSRPQDRRRIPDFEEQSTRYKTLYLCQRVGVNLSADEKHLLQRDLHHVIVLLKHMKQLHDKQVQQQQQQQQQQQDVPEHQIGQQTGQYQYQTPEVSRSIDTAQQQQLDDSNTCTSNDGTNINTTASAAIDADMFDTTDLDSNCNFINEQESDYGDDTDNDNDNDNDDLNIGIDISTLPPYASLSRAFFTHVIIRALSHALHRRHLQQLASLLNPSALPYAPFITPTSIAVFAHPLPPPVVSFTRTQYLISRASKYNINFEHVTLAVALYNVTNLQVAKTWASRFFDTNDDEHLSIAADLMTRLVYDSNYPLAWAVLSGLVIPSKWNLPIAHAVNRCNVEQLPRPPHSKLIAALRLVLARATTQSQFQTALHMFSKSALGANPQGKNRIEWLSLGTLPIYLLIAALAINPSPTPPNVNGIIPPLARRARKTLGILEPHTLIALLDAFKCSPIWPLDMQLYDFRRASIDISPPILLQLQRWWGTRLLANTLARTQRLPHFPLTPTLVRCLLDSDAALSAEALASAIHNITASITTPSVNQFNGLLESLLGRRNIDVAALVVNNIAISYRHALIATSPDHASRTTTDTIDTDSVNDVQAPIKDWSTCPNQKCAKHLQRILQTPEAVASFWQASPVISSSDNIDSNDSNGSNNSNTDRAHRVSPTTTLMCRLQFYSRKGDATNARHTYHAYLQCADAVASLAKLELLFAVARASRCDLVHEDMQRFHNEHPSLCSRLYLAACYGLASQGMLSEAFNMLEQGFKIEPIALPRHFVDWFANALEDSGFALLAMEVEQMAACQPALSVDPTIANDCQEALESMAMQACAQ